MGKVLIVDDDKGATDMLEHVVKTAGHQPVSVNESYKAMDVAINLQPDMILLDLMMPEPTGFQLCRMLRDTHDFAHTPIIIITALDDADSRIVAFGAGATDYITKPLRVGELIDQIKNLIGN